MPDLWITVKIKLRWLYSAVVATKEQAIRDHDLAARETNIFKAQVYRAQGDAHWDANKGLEEVQQKIENDGDRGG